MERPPRGALAATLGWVPQRNPFETIWQPAPVAKGSAPHSISVDLRGLNGSSTVMAVRYAWPFSGDTCCPGQLVKQGLEICKRTASDTRDVFAQQPRLPRAIIVSQPRLPAGKEQRRRGLRCCTQAAQRAVRCSAPAPTCR